MDVIKNISQEEMADFIERIYKNDEVKIAVSQCQNLRKAKTLSDYLGEFLVHYAVSTGDLSDEKISYLASRIAKQYSSQNFITKEELFEKSVQPVLIWQVAKDLALKQPLSIQDMSLVLYNIELQNKNNCFRTHSFNGALFDDVNKNGLDISKELFIDQFRLLSQIGMASPFRTGKLFLCELSYASFGYLHTNPERVFLSFGNIANQKDDQTQQEFLMQCLSDKIDKCGLDEQKKKAILEAGKEIVDFYTTSPNSCMAIQKQQSVGGVATFSQNFFFLEMSALTSKLPYKISKQLETKEFSDACKTKDIEKIDEILKTWAAKFPEISDAVEKAKMDSFSYALKVSALNNFSTAMADGYEVSGGKLKREDFALAKIDDPVKTFPIEHSRGVESVTKKS